ncbi:MAG: WecB/TagA/CpsF family glycosyltransferase [Candidatus Doudnabacteria bacterium]|nr:WecB/TagA/CpsF family glycosyltransferase [Candidatus Doudnabacteria bacterium]
MKIDIAGVGVDNVTVPETLGKIKEFVLSEQPHFIATTYSEFIVQANSDKSYKEILNKADLSLPDGIGILWAAKFLSLPKRNHLITFLNWLGTLFSIILSPKSTRSVIPEQVTGSRLIYDIAQLAQQNNFSLALVGGFYGVAEKSAEVLKKLYPGLKIHLVYEPQTFNQETVLKVSESNSDILLIAYQPPKQEIWINENLKNLNVKVAIGLGGTFDYLSGLRKPAPDVMHKMGLEWFWRLITQPWRIKRMWNAIVIFSFLILNYKLKQ